MRVDSYKDLQIWQMGMDLAVGCYRLTEAFPKAEQYGLTTQFRRSASSVPANIAEGHGRETTGAFIQHLRIAQGSLKETETHILLAVRLGFVSDKETEEETNRISQLGKMIRSLIRRLQEKVQ